MSSYRPDIRTTRIFRVRRCDPTTGEIKETRFYAQQPAAKKRAQRWQALGWIVSLHYGGPIRFQGPRP
jgi:hypothetical protein